VSDTELRELERAAANDPSKKASLVRARVRAGVLDEPRLVLAAQLGHEGASAACAALGVDVKWTHVKMSERMIADAATLLADDTLPARIVLAWVKGPGFRRVTGSGDLAIAQEALASAEAWIEQPFATNREAARRAARRAAESSVRWPYSYVAQACAFDGAHCTEGAVIRTASRVAAAVLRVDRCEPAESAWQLAWLASFVMGER
jgi:hypothetical protein